MDLRQLEYFLRVAQRKNIARLAVTDLNIPQPVPPKTKAHVRIMSGAPKTSMRGPGYR